jgi:hypothetical protein
MRDIQNDRSGAKPRSEIPTAGTVAGCTGLGRTNNFRTVFFSDGSLAGMAGKSTRESLGTIWTTFVAERPELVEAAHLALRLEAEKKSELSALCSVEAVKGLVRAGKVKEAEQLGIDYEQQLAPFAIAAREAVERCFDELVRRGADQEVMWR